MKTNNNPLELKIYCILRHLCFKFFYNNIFFQIEIIFFFEKSLTHFPKSNINDGNLSKDPTAFYFFVGGFPFKTFAKKIQTPEDHLYFQIWYIVVAWPAVGLKFIIIVVVQLVKKRRRLNVSFWFEWLCVNYLRNTITASTNFIVRQSFKENFMIISCEQKKSEHF